MDIKRLALIALLLPGANFPAGAAPELVNGIVAIVNETIKTPPAVVAKAKVAMGEGTDRDSKGK